MHTKNASAPSVHADLNQCVTLATSHCSQHARSWSFWSFGLRFGFLKLMFPGTFPLLGSSVLYFYIPRFIIVPSCFLDFLIQFNGIYLVPPSVSLPVAHYMSRASDWARVECRVLLISQDVYSFERGCNEASAKHRFVFPSLFLQFSLNVWRWILGHLISRFLEALARPWIREPLENHGNGLKATEGKRTTFLKIR